MTAPTPEERVELEEILGKTLRGYAEHDLCQEILALIRERDKARFEAQFLCQALRFLKKEEKVKP